MVQERSATAAFSDAAIGATQKEILGAENVGTMEQFRSSSSFKHCVVSFFLLVLFFFVDAIIALVILSVIEHLSLFGFMRNHGVRVMMARPTLNQPDTPLGQKRVSFLVSLILQHIDVA